MKVMLDNAQHTPHLDIIIDGKIVKRLDICEDGFMLNGKSLQKKDGIVIYSTKEN